MSTPSWAVGMRRLIPGLYGDSDGSIHLCAEEVCESRGYAPTPENLQIVRELAAQAARSIYGESLVMIELKDEVPS